jgi:hypothetical protein
MTKPLTIFIYFFNTVTHTMYGTQPNPAGTGGNYVTFSPDGSTMAYSDNGTSIYLWSTAGLE